MSSKTMPAKTEQDPRSVISALASTAQLNLASHVSAENEALARLEPLASPIRTRLHQRVHVTAERDPHIFLVRRGTFLTRVALSGEATPITSLLFQGDIYHSGSALPHAGANLVTGSETGELWRLRASVLDEQSARCRDLNPMIMSRMAETSARQTFHTVVIAALTGEERVAALFLELALKTGTKTDAGISFEMPLSRTDVADYLALNADTVSRIFSRLRAKTLITTTQRNRLACPDLDALAKECPLASTVAALAKLRTGAIAL